MKYQVLELEHYKLHLINTNKYKKNILSVCFKKELKKSELTKRIFLANILNESCKKYKTYRDLQIKCEDLYELNSGIYNLRSGKINVLTANINLLNEKYTEKNMFKESVDYLCELLFNPNITNSKFDLKSFNRVKKYMTDDIKSIKDNPGLYSINRMFNELDKTNPISYDISMNELNKITPSNLYEYYLSVINNEQVDIYLIGEITDEMIKIILDKFKFKNNKFIDIKSYSRYKVTKLKTVKESLKVNQSILRMAYSFDNLSFFEDRYVSFILNYILGGGSDSLLFKNVREKESLCYSINSNYNIINGLLLISSGINKKDYSKTKKIILEQISKLKQGKFSTKEIKNGIKYYENYLSTTQDTIGSALDMYKSFDYVESEPISEKIKNFNKVTKKDIISLANKMHLSIIFLLEGDNNE